MLLVEGALTAFWKEPLSALFAARTQQALGEDLEALERASAAEAVEAARSRKKTLQYQHRRAVRLRREVGVGEPIGRLRIDKFELDTVVVNGTDEETSLKSGPGQQPETPLPGQKGDWTSGIAGHRTTYGAAFRHIDKIEKGDDIVYTLPYGRYTFEVEKTRIVDAAIRGPSSRRAPTRSPCTRAIPSTAQPSGSSSTASSERASRAARRVARS